MADPVPGGIETFMPDAQGADTNLPAGASSMQPGSTTELAGTLRQIKSVVRQSVTLDNQWTNWVNLYGTLTYISPTSFSLTGDQRLSGGGPVQAARAIRATLGSGFVYAYIVNDVFSSGVTTVTLGSAVLDGTLSQVDFGSPTLGLGGLPGAPFAQVSNSADQSIPNAALTPLSFDTLIDGNAATDVYNPGSPDRLFIPTSGLWTFTAQCTFVTNGTGVRGIGFDINGVTTSRFGVMKIAAVSGDTTDLCVCAQAFINVGSYVQCGVLQTSGGALDVNANTFTPAFSAVFQYGAKKQP